MSLPPVVNRRRRWRRLHFIVSGVSVMLGAMWSWNVSQSLVHRYNVELERVTGSVSLAL